MTALVQETAPALVTLSGRPGGLGSTPMVGAGAWQRRYVRRLFIGDAIVVAMAAALAVALRSGGTAGGLRGLSYAGAAMLIVLAWLGALAAGRAYEPRFLGCGSEEYKRVTNASLHLLGGVALLALALRLAPARSFVVLALVIGTGLLLAHRYVARRVLYRARLRGANTHRVIALGCGDAVGNLVETLSREPRAGFQIVGACAPHDTERLLDLTAELGADTIAVTASAGITPGLLRRISWQLEDRGIALIVAPALTDVAGPRVAIRPVAGLPLLHVERPDITGARYLFKELVERALAAAILVLAAPLFLVIALAIKLTSPGAVFFSQVRVSRHGEPFRILKFRSMRDDAESLLELLQEHNEADGGRLFKMRCDPRVTSVGRLLRRWSLDELPQLLNVVRGDMALVGPRPPLPVEVAGYTDGVHRRLLVKPGMTGLWQVSGRSDLSWDESVRLDLYYVENWSLSLDLQILWRTVSAVVRAAGAY